MRNVAWDEECGERDKVRRGLSAVWGVVQFLQRSYPAASNPALLRPISSGCLQPHPVPIFFYLAL